MLGNLPAVALHLVLGKPFRRAVVELILVVRGALVGRHLLRVLQCAAI
jgi:hypothetical protein